MQEFLYYGGLENAGHYAPFAKDGIQSGNGFFSGNPLGRPVGALWGLQREIPPLKHGSGFTRMEQQGVQIHPKISQMPLKFNGSGRKKRRGGQSGKGAFDSALVNAIREGHKKQKGGRAVKAQPVMKRMPMPMQPAPAMKKLPAVKEAPKTLWQRAKAFIKDNQLLSRGLGELGSLADKTKMFKSYAPYLTGAATTAGLAGWGKKKRRGKKARK